MSLPNGDISVCIHSFDLVCTLPCITSVLKPFVASSHWKRNTVIIPGTASHISIVLCETNNPKQSSLCLERRLQTVGSV